MARARAALAATGVEGDSSDAAGWLALYEGNLKSARALLRGGTGSSPELASALGLIARLKVDSAPAIGRAFLALARGDSVGATAQFVQAAAQTPRRSVVAAAARGADSGNVEERNRRRSRCGRRFSTRTATRPRRRRPSSSGRDLLRKRGDAAGATTHLEHMILTYPQSALVPQARRELELVEERHSSNAVMVVSISRFARRVVVAVLLARCAARSRSSRSACSCRWTTRSRIISRRTASPTTRSRPARRPSGC